MYGSELNVKDKVNLKISVVLSFYNEENVIEELLARMRAVFSKLIADKKIGSYELIFVNDNSTDNSEKMLLAEINNKDIVLVNMTRNFGVSECVMAGISQAKGDAVIYMDADLQDPPELIPELIEKWQADKDIGVVYTTRTKRLGESRLKMLITKIGYKLINFISDVDLPRDSGDFKLLSRNVVDKLLALKEDKPYMRGLISWIGYKQVQVFYERMRALMVGKIRKCLY